MGLKKQAHAARKQCNTRLVVLCLLCGFLLVVNKDYFSPLDSSHVQGSDHQVELYTYSQHRGGSGEWSSWEDFGDQANLMVMEDEGLQSEGEVVPIGKAHHGGLLHRGVWLAVLRRSKPSEEGSYQALFVQRSQTLKTCAGSWSLVGEHSNQGESWQDTAARAMREELQLSVSMSSVVNLFPDQSLLVRTVYQDSGRKELQATALFAVVLEESEVHQIKLDEEAVDVQWRSVSALYEDETASFCNADITALAALMGQRLKELGYS